MWQTLWLRRFCHRTLWPTPCQRCHADNSTIKIFFEENMMNPRKLPPELKDLTVVEQQLISTISPCINVHLLKHAWGYWINWSLIVLLFLRKWISRMPVMSAPSHVGPSAKYQAHSHGGGGGGARGGSAPLDKFEPPLGCLSLLL